MTTLEAIGYTTAGCGSIAAFTFAFFAVAVRTRSCNIAPRCTARSKDTIYNPKAKRGKRSFFLFGRKDTDGGSKSGVKKGERGKDGFVGHNEDDGASVDSEKKTKEEVQYRGGPMFGWIPWTLSISYDQLLTGVPGTGTRKGGMEGSLLRVNLDGIILLRFHALCLRVSILATIIGIALILPLNITARCFSFSEDDYVSPQCNSSDYNITNYEQTTLANIPSLDAGSGDGVSWLYGWFGSSVSIFGSKFSSYLGRLYAVVGFSWILVFYTLHLMKKEWVDALALRRVYYLEGFHWENRISELHQTVLNYESDSSDDGADMKPGAMEKRRMINRSRVSRSNKRKKKKKSKDVAKRDPWIPHPEQRETVPNIELYSVLVGNIPSLPSEVAAEGDLESMGFSRSECLDWQLAVTAAFFDQCVPNQPGFSSSVAAVTILPDAPKLAKAWRAWYKHVGLLRRLRYVRALIAKKRYYEIEEVGEEDEESNRSDIDEGTDAPLGDGKSLDVLFPLDQSSSSSDGARKKNGKGGHQFKDSAIEDHLDVSPDALNGSNKELNDMKLLQHRINYYKDVFGADIDADGGVELEKSLIMHALEYGPEQTAVYSREFAQGAAACCPNGCREERLHYYELKDLEILEEEITDALVESFEELLNAQKSNVANNEDSKKGNGQNQLSPLNGGQSPTIQNVGSMEDIKLPSKYDIESRLLSRTPKKYIPGTYEEAEGEDNMHDRADFMTRTSNNEQSQHIGNDESPVDRSLHPTNKMSSSFSHREEFPSRITLSNQGRVYFKESTVFGPRNGSFHGGSFGSHSSQGPQSYNKDTMSKRGEWINDMNQNGLRPRQRVNTGMSQMSMAGFDVVGQWEKVQQIIHDDEVAKGVASEHRRAFSGVWKIPTISSIIRKLREKLKSMRKRTKNVVEDFASDSTFAVVTFTSRQAAIAARHCLADGRGADRWIPVEDIPVPPLADAAAGDLKTCRGCCRPVTLTVNPKQQFVRKYTAIFMLAAIFVFYTVPLTLIANLAAPENMKKVIPVLAELANVNPFLDRLLQGFVPALLNSLFFSLCPVMFKAISNFGSNAISVNQAEYNALQYYWAFMVVTAFSGTSLAQIGLAYLGGKQAEGNTFTTILIFVAGRLPGQVSANWLNWIILRSLVILPLQYMLQVNTFIFQWLGWKCCRRCVMGGGPGGPVPYRIYIDSGVVFMCIVALSPVSPLVAPASMLYFLYCAPLWRRNCIYIYRPKFDTGGLRWPFLSDILISSLCVGQVLLTTAMALKEAVGPAILSAFPVIPILVHRRFNRKRYLKSYLDCALLQTSQLDGWDNEVPTSQEKREEYRKFLVDAHKAAYVPICIASSTTATKLTAEPAVVVEHKNDVLQPVPMSDMNATLGYHCAPERDVRHSNNTDHGLGYAATTPTLTGPLFAERAKPQYFASFRRLKQTSFIDQGAIGSESFGIGD